MKDMIKCKWLWLLLLMVISAVWISCQMKVIEFNQLIKSKKLQDIIYMHCRNEITLTNKQLDKLLTLKKIKETELWKK